ncbi:MAG: dTMP kinase [Thermoplasmata archaeon]
MSIFIVLEGIDGSGKSTVTRHIASEFQNVYSTREPTGCAAGRLAKRIAHENTSPYYDLFLYLADRVHHTRKIQNILENGRDVICDRYWGSTAAYQAAKSEIQLNYLVDIQEPFVLRPDLTLLFDIDPEMSLKRIQTRDETSKYERLEFLQNVRENYLTLAKDHGWEIINAHENIEDVCSEVKKIIKKVKGFRGF